MKRNTTTALTEEQLKKALKPYATKDDLKDFATKDDLHTLENKVMGKLDYIVAELETIREDREFAVYQTRELREDVDDHEQRLKKLEKITT